MQTGVQNYGLAPFSPPRYFCLLHLSAYSVSEAYQSFIHFSSSPNNQRKKESLPERLTDRLPIDGTIFFNHFLLRTILSPASLNIINYLCPDSASGACSISSPPFFFPLDIFPLLYFSLPAFTLWISHPARDNHRLPMQAPWSLRTWNSQRMTRGCRTALVITNTPPLPPVF